MMAIHTEELSVDQLRTGIAVGNFNHKAGRLSLATTAVYALALAPATLVIAIAALQPWIPVEELLRDPLAVAELSKDCCHAYYGLLSSLGVVVWVAGAAICLFAAALLFLRRGLAGATLFMGAAGLFTGWLALDDLLLLHDDVFPALGISQPVTYGAYAGLALMYMLLSWRQILQNHAGLFVIAGALLATSVMIDWQFHSDHPLRIILEDGAKFVGISAWTMFHVLAAAKLVVAAPDVSDRIRQLGMERS